MKTGGELKVLGKPGEDNGVMVPVLGPNHRPLWPETVEVPLDKILPERNEHGKKIIAPNGFSHEKLKDPTDYRI